MKKVSLLLLNVIALICPAFAQNSTDSLVLFRDLKYHSEFEKKSITNYVKNKTDTFNCFLAIDEKITSLDAINSLNTYLAVYNLLDGKKIDSKKLNQKIKITYSTVHDYFLKKYNNIEYFPSIFQNGFYNCVSASALYAIVFGQVQIPYKVMASFNHVYLIASPGDKSIVIETTNPSFESAIFNGDFKEQYVNSLRGSKLISEAEYKNKSTDEIFAEKFREVKEAEFSNLLGFQYYNKALTKLENNQTDKAYELCQKAYFFFPDPQVKTMLNISLLYQIEKVKFENLSDIDYLVQLSRFENVDINMISNIFSNIIKYNLQFRDKESYCDSLFQRFASQISDQDLLKEVGFSYYLNMSYRYAGSDKAGYYVSNALKIKGNHKDANAIMETFINNKLIRITDPNTLLDTIQNLEKRYSNDQISKILDAFKQVSYLKSAGDLYQDNKPSAGEKYLLKFEANCKTPIENQVLYHYIESTYRSIAVYYYYKNEKVKASKYIDRALIYIPESNLKQSAVYQRH
jgi:hypothetical protein